MGLCAGFYGHSLLSPPRSGQTILSVQSAVKGTLTPMFYYFAICHRGRGVVALGTHRIKLIFLQAEVVEVVMGWGGGATWICVTLSQTTGDTKEVTNLLSFVLTLTVVLPLCSKMKPFLRTSWSWVVSLTCTFMAEM